MYGSLPEGPIDAETSIWNEKNSLMFRNDQGSGSDRTLPPPDTLPQTGAATDESIITVRNDGFRGNIMNEDLKKRQHVSFNETALDGLTTSASLKDEISPELKRYIK